MPNPDVESQPESPKYSYPEFRNEKGEINRTYVRHLVELVKARQQEEIREVTCDLHESDLADLLEIVPPDIRAPLIRQLGETFDVNTLPQLDEQVISDLVEELPQKIVVDAVRELESDDAVYVIESLEDAEREAILAKMPESERRVIETGLQYPEDSAGRMMQRAFVAIPSFWTVGQTLDYLRNENNLPSKFSEVFVTSPMFALRGTLSLQDIICSDPDTVIRSMIRDVSFHQVYVNQDREEVARDFERYDLLSAPVIDKNERLVGIITVDDIVDVIHEEAEEDILRMGGVTRETSLTDNILETATGRFGWLLVNLVTAILASAVIQLFDATIEQMVALAVLMPIVASMGGNAATQTMTVAVRALSTRELGRVNANRIIIRETVVGLLNGLAFALIMAVLVYFWFKASSLGLVIGIAMVLNLLVAGLSGILVPLFLDRAGIDPAIASSVFVTTITDVVGFFLFLGLAAAYLV